MFVEIDPGMLEHETRKLDIDRMNKKVIFLELVNRNGEERAILIAI